MTKGGAIVEDPGLRILANRRGPAGVELHEHTNHIFIIVEGEATIVTGGTMVDAKRTGPDQMAAANIEGGEMHHLTKGDVITIPAKTPHWWKEISSGHGGLLRGEHRAVGRSSSRVFSPQSEAASSELEPRADPAVARGARREERRLLHRKLPADGGNGRAMKVPAAVNPVGPSCAAVS